MSWKNTILAGVLLMASHSQASADGGLMTKPNKYTVQQTIEKFEAAVKSKAAGGWIVVAGSTTPPRQRTPDWRCAHER